MPLYEYYCSDCHTKFELLTTFDASTKDIVCKHCHNSNVHRLISVFNARRGGDGEFGDGYHWNDAGSSGGCGCGGSCACGGHA
jgi:putative FmdB family regulatory protein